MKCYSACFNVGNIGYGLLDCFFTGQKYTYKKHKN